MEWTGERDTFDSCPSQIVAKKAESRNFSISFLDISSTKIKGRKASWQSRPNGNFLATDQKGQFGITSSVKQTEDLQKIQWQWNDHWQIQFKQTEISNLNWTWTDHCIVASNSDKLKYWIFDLREEAVDNGALCEWGQALRYDRVQWVSSGETFNNNTHQ